MLDIKATAMMGTDINQAAKEAIVLSAFAKRIIMLVFNGVEISVSYSSTLEEVAEVYHNRIRYGGKL